MFTLLEPTPNVIIYYTDTERITADLTKLVESHWSDVEIMTCYFKNSRMKDLLEEIGIVASKENMRAIDEALHEYLSVDYRNCAATWKMIRKRLKEDGKGFKERLRTVLAAFR